MAQIPFNALRVLEAVARHGSFSRAAEELCVTQSAVSHQVRHLEAWIGGPLFERQGNRALLLPHGADLSRELALAFAGVEAAVQRARRAGAPATLTVAVIPSVAICRLIPRLGAFRAAAPGIEVRIVYAIYGQRIDFRDVDLAVVYAVAPPALPGMSMVRFMPGRAAPVCAPHLGRPETAGQMLDAGLLHDTDASGWREWFGAVGAAGMAVAAGPVFEDFNLLRVAALAGQGVALCPLALVADDITSGRLVQLSDIAIRDECGYYVVMPVAPDTRRAAAIEAFREWLLATAHQ